MFAAFKRHGLPLTGIVLVLFAGLLAAGCQSSRGCEAPCATACAAQPACAPCAAVEPVGQCGPRPPEAKCGEAWCCVYIPPVYAEQCDQCLVCPAKERCVWVPPTYGTRPKLVCRKPAELKEQITPAVWGQQKRDVIVAPGCESLVCVDCPPSNLAPGERQIQCIAKCCTPPVWGQECERICIEPERRCVGFKPAEYECVEETYQLSPGFYDKSCEPAKYETRTRTVCVQPGRWEWRLNEKCAPPPALAALQVEMVDVAPDGTPAGLFKVGTQARYDMIVSSDAASAAMKGLSVTFTLPPELEFVSGNADHGVTITGSGATAQSSAFDLQGNQQMRLTLLVNVKGAPANEQVVVSAVVKDSAGEVLATESENSSVPNLK